MRSLSGLRRFETQDVEIAVGYATQPEADCFENRSIWETLQHRGSTIGKVYNDLRSLARRKSDAIRFYGGFEKSSIGSDLQECSLVLESELVDPGIGPVEDAESRRPAFYGQLRIVGTVYQDLVAIVPSLANAIA